MRYYPVFLDLVQSRCLVVGAGQVGCRKIAGLLAGNPLEIRVLDSAVPSKELQVLLEDSRIHFEQRAFTPADVSGKQLVFAATSNRAVNASVTAACATQGVLCNCVDAPEEGGFIVPAHLEKGNITVALSTAGGSPALSRKIREELDEWLDGRFEALSELLSRLRPLVLALRRETGQNTLLFRNVVRSPLADALRRRDLVQSEEQLRLLLPQELHPHIMELLHDLA
ncbi:MAG: bifunctional precorrin-2 dehydrogenase/sirohydrochlorin ferrochelatase [Bilophila sp.]